MTKRIMKNYKIISKYIKHLDFQIPNSKVFALLTKNISSYKINIDIKSNQLGGKLVEIEISLNLNPVKEDFEKINTKIVYSAVIEIDEQLKDKLEIEKIILIDVPTEIYPELRKIFVFIFENSGFKDVKISKDVNFQKLYNHRKAQ
tara:strand:+ start:666 stop:1103 length:438 start_codon:yes stop_codon:yes gene_type:complete